MASRKVRIRYKRLLVFLFVVLFLVFLFFKVINLRITNIYVSGNYYLSDQSIIELAKIQNYPRTIFVPSSSLESNINGSDFIKSASVSKKWFTQVYIDVAENRPMFYDEVNKKTVLLDGKLVSDVYNVPILTNSVSSEIYDDFLYDLSLIDLNVFNYISEITYKPNDVDKELFLFFMNDGNYIYVNLDKFTSVNKYFDMVVNFNNHKGILYLDSGEYFKILDN